MPQESRGPEDRPKHHVQPGREPERSSDCWNSDERSAVLTLYNVTQDRLRGGDRADEHAQEGKSKSRLERYQRTGYQISDDKSQPE